MRKQAPILLLRPRPSRATSVVIAGMHGLGLVAVWLSAWPWWGALALSVALFASGIRLWRMRLPLHELQWGPGESWRLDRGEGEPLRALLDARASRSLPWWIWLAFRLDGGGRLGCLLPLDSLPADDFRRLRVRLRVEAGRVAKRGSENL